MKRNSFICLAIICSMAVISDGNTASVNPKISLSHSKILSGQANSVFVVVDFDVAQIENGKERAPLNIGLVLDRSGSMEDRGKMGHAKKAAQKMVDHLEASDSLAVVEYDDEITVLWSSKPATKKERIKTLIGRLHPRGSTNLVGGMLSGASEVERNTKAGQINRVLLLSDGLANQGVTNPREIKKLVRQIKANGVQISTMGLGLDFNEDLMQEIAEYSGGNYYYIEHPNQAARLFREEMSIMVASVAKNPILEYSWGDSVKDVKVYGYVHRNEGRKTTIEQEDFHSRDTRQVILKIELQSVDVGNLDLGKVRLAYQDLIAKTEQSIEAKFDIDASADRNAVKASLNKKAASDAALVSSAEEYAKALKLFEEGKKDEALEQVQNTAKALSQQNTQLNDVRIRKKLDGFRMEAAEMNQASTSTRSRSSYLKRKKSRRYKSGKGRHTSYVLQEGDQGYRVEQLQGALKTRKFYSGPVDGKYTATLSKAVKDFQAKHGLSTDGVAGPATLGLLGLY